MQDLGMIPLIDGTATRDMRSALPHSPVVPDPRPGRLRISTAALLRRAAARLDREPAPVRRHFLA